MRFVQIINQKKFTLICIFLCLYVILNLFDGERGLISYFEKKAILDEELRSVSIRVNLFEKRLIPDTEHDMAKIKIFLGDQDLAAVSLSKLAKEKLEKRKILQMEKIA